MLKNTKEKPVPDDVYVFGHSLDITDRDILARFVSQEWASVHIYANDKITEGNLIANTIKLVTEEVVIDKASRTPAMLEYID